jgi:hypothetical protein
MEKLTYNITGLTFEQVQLIEAAPAMRDALRAVLAPDESREECADLARAALKKAGIATPIEISDAERAEISEQLERDV